MHEIITEYILTCKLSIYIRFIWYNFMNFALLKFENSRTHGILWKSSKNWWRHNRPRWRHRVLIFCASQGLGSKLWMLKKNLNFDHSVDLCIFCIRPYFSIFNIEKIDENELFETLSRAFLGKSIVLNPMVTSVFWYLWDVTILFLIL